MSHLISNFKHSTDNPRRLRQYKHLSYIVIIWLICFQILFDGGTVQDYLSTVNTWMRANPNEVLTFIFTNPDGASLTELWDPAFQNSGIADLLYVPPSVPVKQSDVRSC